MNLSGDPAMDWLILASPQYFTSPEPATESLMVSVAQIEASPEPAIFKLTLLALRRSVLSVWLG